MSGFPLFGRVFGEHFGKAFGQGGNNTLLPLTLDFSQYANGGIPSPLQGSTWAIVSGKAVNTPTLGAELLTDPGLEATYTAGLCDTLTKAGGPTLAQSADVHGGSKAQEFTAAAGGNSLNWANATPTAHTWYQFSLWCKRTAGTQTGTLMQINQTGGIPNAAPSSQDIISATYKQYAVSILSPTTAAINPRALFQNGGAPFDTIIIDDGSLKPITTASPFATVPATQADVVIKIMPPGTYAGFADACWMGIMLRMDSATAPTNYIMASIRPRQAGTTLGVANLIKRVGATYTTLISDSIITIAASAWLEVRASGSTISLWYNGTQVGTDQTVSDAGILNNSVHGMYSTGGNAVDRFLLQAN